MEFKLTGQRINNVVELIESKVLRKTVFDYLNTCIAAANNDQHLLGSCWYSGDEIYVLDP